MLKKVWAYLVIITGAVAGGTLATFVPDGHESQANSPPALITPALFAATPVVANKPVVDGELTGDWKQWGGSSDRNNVAVGVNIPTAWEVGDIDEETGAWDAASAENIKWVAQCGSQTYGNVVIADGRAFIGTNNRAGYLARYPGDIDLGCLLCFSTKDGSFLWQHSSEKLDTGRVHDWPLQGVCCASYVEGNRLWFVTSRGEVVCLDTEGYHDGEDDGPAKAGMGRLFLESPLLQAGLDENNLLPALAALLETNGVSLDGQTRLKVEEEGTRWLLQIRGEDGTAFYRITREDPQLHVVKIADEQETNGQPVVSAHTRLTEGLDQGQVSPALAALLAKRGFDLKQVKVTKDGNAWKLAGTVDGKPRTGLVRMQGPNLTAFKQITAEDKGEADQIWVYDMMKEQAVSQHNMCSCSVTAMGDLLFVNTSNGVDESHKNIPSPNAPSFMAMNKNTGKVLWTDKSPGLNILHGQWSSPMVANLAGVPQVIFGGGDGWVYSFQADVTDKPELLWKFDANPKDSKWLLGGAGTRNNIIGTPVAYKDRVYVAVGQDPEHGDGVGHLWCIDPSKRGDVSPQLVVEVNDRKKIVPPRREQNMEAEKGEVAIDNPNSAAIWHFYQFDYDGDGEISFEETMRRTCGTVAIKDDLLFIADFSGLFHCLNAMTGEVYWNYDMLSVAWGSPLIVDGHVYIGDEDGDVSIFNLSREPHEPIAEINMLTSVYSTPVVSHNVLYISNKSHLFAIANDDADTAEGDANEGQP